MKLRNLALLIPLNVEARHRMCYPPWLMDSLSVFGVGQQMTLAETFDLISYSGLDSHLCPDAGPA